MANIKVSEMTEATSFDDGDYTMIVQANQNKKIARENILGDVEDDISTINTNISTINTNIGDLTNLQTPSTDNLVNAINSVMEIGNNEKGTYIKYFNGLLICFNNLRYSANGDFTQDGTINYKNIGNWTFPHEFLSEPTAIGTANTTQTTGTRRIWVTFSGITNTNLQNITVCTNWNASYSNGLVGLIAIGKWK